MVFTMIMTLSFPCFSQGLPASSPGNLGFSKERLQRIAPIMNEYVEKGLFPGAIVSIARHGQVAYFERFGYSDIENKIPVKDDDIFRIYSMTKPITSVAVAILFEEGKFLLDDPVEKYLTPFKDLKVFRAVSEGNIVTDKCERKMTIRDLLRQTCGLGYGWGSHPVDTVYKEFKLFDPSSTLAEMTEKLGKIPLYFQPGSQWQYSVAIDVLGRLVEVVSGQTLEEFFAKRIFTPLKMIDTGFFVPEDKLGRFTKVYQHTAEEGLKPLPHEQAYERYAKDKNRMLSGGGGLVSTASDYMRFAQMLANGGELEGVRILSRKTVELMSSNQLPDTISSLPWTKLQGHGYGFAVSVLTDMAKSPTIGTNGDYGWDGAASTYFRIDPQENLVILLMTHRQPCDDEIQIKLKTLTYQALVD